ncbi:FISUMP domain-containing protein [Flavobacterium sp.]|uniref:FISUMP domain-containing protein n=1 Tax=Flavobacterium sp. TaxID=239 RepID=UPI00262CC4E5|nr:FISUMP domain-containing protein [Flavobacterium sp.]
MKNRILYFNILIFVVMFFGCSTSTDSNENTVTNIIPLSPTGLMGNVASSSQINLSWSDNSSNEIGFKIERRTASTNYAVVGTVNQDILIFSDSGLTPNTTYIYRVCAYNAVGNSLTYTNDVTLTTTATVTLPTLTTSAASAITQTAAVTSGTISNDGGAAITERGVCWSTSFNPTISLSTRTTEGTGIGTFTSNITGLIANTTYYVRAYATNSLGTAYGNQITFTTLQNSSAINIPGPNVIDIDGNIYQSVTNCGLTFTKQNLNVSKYSDGTPIPQVTDPTEWANLTTGAWCYYNNTTANGTTYGKLYNWYAVAGIYDGASAVNPSLRKKLAPTGWHIPTNAEWSQLTDCLGGAPFAGGKMKATGISLWLSPNTAATNESGFTGYPGGHRYFYGPFDSIGYQGEWWSSTEESGGAWQRWLYYGSSLAVSGLTDMKEGYSVRCLRD